MLLRFMQGVVFRVGLLVICGHLGNGCAIMTFLASYLVTQLSVTSIDEECAGSITTSACSP
jgi:hypothetical protein